MASISCYYAPTTIRASSGSDIFRNPDPNRKRTVSWWAPLFGVSTDPDYLNIEGSSVSPELNPDQIDISRPSQRLRRGCLTEEKARQLRRKTAEASTFHDVMYHSAIASRLASGTSGPVED